MSDAYISFEREGLDGTVAVGSRISDVFKRFGVKFEKECSQTEEVHFCEVTVTAGLALLSDVTNDETEHFAKNGRRINGRRLACEARIIKSGEIVIMTQAKQEAPKKETPRKNKFHEEFKELSLEEKIKTLLKMEAVTLQETFSYGLNESMKAADRLGDVLADFGKKVEAEFKKATHHDENGPSPKSKPRGSKKSPPRSPKG